MSTTFVIFGASGDLTARKLIPALYNNFRKRRLPEPTTILGFARTPFTDEAFRNKMKEGVKTHAPEDYDETEWDRFAVSLFYEPGDIGDPDGFRRLSDRMRAIGTSADNSLFYLATAPQFYSTTIGMIGQNNMLVQTPQTGFRRIVVEKPFGRDLTSARALNEELRRVATEEQVYRIDHYLGKETVQNVLMLRFGNAIFEPLWNRNYVDHVQITVAEIVGVEHRAGYYDATGALRDMFQNHLLQLLTLVAMEPPDIVEANALRNEKVKILRAIRETVPEQSTRHTVRGQYEGYRSEPGVDPHSTTETYAAVQLYIDNWRWQGVPFYLRSGKAMKEKMSEILIQFRRPPTQIFDVQAGVTELFTNRLSICVQPDEGMHLRFITKVPDQGMTTRPVEMDFHYRDSFGNRAIPEAYERLLLDALLGDASLFARSDEIELAWTIVDRIREGWDSQDNAHLHPYKRGSWGPDASDRLLGQEGRWWLCDCAGHDQTNAEHSKHE